MLTQRGLSLIELMIAMVIGLVLMLGVTQVFLSTRQVYSNQEAVSRIQESGRLALEFMSRDTRMAGYAGCAVSGYKDPLGNFRGVQVDNKISPVAPLVDFANGIEGIDNATGPSVTYDIDPVVGTDVLVVRAQLGKSIPIVAPNSPGQIPVFANATTNIANGCSAGVDQINGLCPGNIVVVSDCAKAIAFRIITISSTGVITHTPFSSAATLPPAEKFHDVTGDNGEIGFMSTIVYFVRTSPTTGRRGLWQKNGFNDSVELLEGIEDMQLTYGVDTNADGIPDSYRSATAIADWSDVKSVRAEMLVQSTDDNVVPDSQPYTFNGIPVTPTDHRLRQIFVSTMAIRGRLP